MNELNENFTDLFNNSIANVNTFEKSVVKGVVIAVDNNFVTFDVGLKSEGKIDINEFKNSQGQLIDNLQVGEYFDVYIDKYENESGSIVLSRDKARREENWHYLEEMFVKEEILDANVLKRVRGGFSVIVHDTVAFLPGSQLDVRPMRNSGALVGTDVPVQIVKMDKKRYNIVVSRKAVIEKSGSIDHVDIKEKFAENQIVEGVVKNITGYGVFVDLGSVDGLLHITDISWNRINHPSEVVKVGDSLQLKVIKIDPESNRISLGLKQLAADPWENLYAQYAVGTTHELPIHSVAPYGVFVSLNDNVDGLVHISEMSWVKKDIHPEVDYAIGDILKVKVIEVDPKKRRINLSVKRCEDNPWETYATQYPEGSLVTATVKAINNSGMVVALNDVIDGFIRNADLAWSEEDQQLLINKYSVGDTIEAKIIKIQLEKDKILLGIKQMSDEPVWEEVQSLRKGDTVECKVVEISEKGLDVEVAPNVVGFIKEYDLSMDRMEQRVTNFNVGDRVKAMIVNINTYTKIINLSIKAFENAEYKRVMNSSKSGGDNSFADAFNQALEKKEQENS